MSKILTPLWLEDVDGDNWIVCAPFLYQSDLLKGIVEVPIRTTTDLASIPWIIRGLIPKSGKYNKAAVLHDAGYRGNLVTEDGLRINLIKELCDSLFLEVMGVVGVSPVLAKLMYQAVKEFGKPKDQSHNIIGG